MSFKTIELRGDSVVMIDQRRLPREEVYNIYTDPKDVAQAIKDMVVRGAPAIGVAAAMGIAIGVKSAARKSENGAKEIERYFQEVTDLMRSTRPTAVNLFWAIERMKGVFEANKGKGPKELSLSIEKEAIRIYEEDIEACRAMGKFGSELLGDNTTVLTHCNAGALATAGYGTALGIIRAAVEQGKKIHVYADETRPFLQGARLTSWELLKDNIPVTLISDSMAGYLMNLGKISCVIVGTDRVAANGDVANKIGTYSLSVLAKEHGLPFYVAAPLSTIDLKCPDGKSIPIEHRNPSEVTNLFGTPIAPEGVEVFNPAFDVTPAALVTAIITEKGIARAPYSESLKRLKEKA